MTTESDRELLELAAKAAGYNLQFAKAPGLAPEPYLRWKSRDVYWNPLTDDGDALRLAAKLDLLNNPRMIHERDVLMFTKGVEKLEATRRAIVRAAAAIARATHKEQT